MPAAWAPIVDGAPLPEGAGHPQIQHSTATIAAAPSATSTCSPGVLACGKCGQRLQGKSAYSSNGKRHRYYSHRTKCPEGGLDRIDAEMAQELVLAWLRDVASNGERFRELEAQGRKRIARQHRRAPGLLEGAGSGRAPPLKERVEARIQELTRTKAEAVRDSIEKSITDLRQRKKELDEKRLFADHAIRELESIVQNDGDLFSAYSRRIRKVLDAPAEGLKAGLPGTDCEPAVDGHRNKTGSLRGTPERASSPAVCFISPGRTRTSDLVINSHPLYRLSYRGIPYC